MTNKVNSIKKIEKKFFKMIEKNNLFYKNERLER